MKPRPAHTAVRRRLIAALVATGGLAVVAGIALIAQPDGHLLRMSAERLNGTPFASYRVPGLVLAALIGGTQLYAARALLTHDPRGLRLATIAGLTLAGWVAVQVAVLDAIMWIQPVLFLVAFVEVMLVAANLPRKPAAKPHRKRR